MLIFYLAISVGDFDKIRLLAYEIKFVVSSLKTQLN